MLMSLKSLNSEFICHAYADLLWSYPTHKLINYFKHWCKDKDLGKPKYKPLKLDEFYWHDLKLEWYKSNNNWT